MYNFFMMFAIVYKICHWGGTLSKLMMYHFGSNLYILGTDM